MPKDQFGSEVTKEVPPGAPPRDLFKGLGVKVHPASQQAVQRAATEGPGEGRPEWDGKERSKEEVESLSKKVKEGGGNRG